MLKKFKTAITVTLMIGFSHFANADTLCPSNIIKPFSGQWKGQGLLIYAQGTQKQMANQDVFTVLDCQRFHVTVSYFNASGEVIRTVDFVASPDLSGQAGLFTLDGTVTEGSAVNPMSGSIRQIQDGTLLLTISAALGGQPVYITELMNVITLPSGESQIVRTLQMFAGQRGGPYVASRVTTEVKIQN
jgi:hypothetical protein